MSQGVHSGNVAGSGRDPQNEPKLIDSSAPLFSMYNERAKGNDEKLAESWKGDAEGILVFTGLFSAAVAQLLGSSLQNLQLDPQNASSFYLARAYQLTPGSNASNIRLPDDPDSFKPPKTAIWVSALWSLSLVISLTCALLATLLQQWARRYLRITQKRNDPQKRAQVRELMRKALKKPVLRLRLMVEVLPALLHTSVFLFLVGFVAYLSSFNLLVAKLAGASVGASSLLYLYVSFGPLHSRDSPYYTPLTTIIWSIYMGIMSLFLQLRHFVASRWPDLGDADHILKSFEFYYQRMLKGTTKDVEELADDPSSDLAFSVLSSTFDLLDGDNDIEQFLSNIPGFYASGRVKLDGDEFNDFNSAQLPGSIISFMDHVLSSKLLLDSEKQNRVAICSRAMNTNPFLLQSTFLQSLQTLNSHISNKIFTGSAFVGLALEQLDRHDSDAFVKDYAQCIVAVAINRADLNDPVWIDIAQRYLKPRHEQYRNKPLKEPDIRLCSLIYLTRQLTVSRLKNSNQFERGMLWHNALVEARKLDVRNAASELRNEFLTLLYELVGLKIQGSRTTRRNAGRILDLLSSAHTTLMQM